MKTIVAMFLQSGLCMLGCHNNKPAQNPNNPPPPVQGPPP